MKAASRRTRVERAVADEVARLGLGASSVLVAVSGGVDSVCLADAVVRVGPDLSLHLALAHVDHALRGDESEGDAAFVAAFAQERGLQMSVRRADPRPLRADGASRIRPTLQEAARRARYAALEAMRVAHGCDWILTAHTADDQAETLMLRLLRGASPESLAGIVARDDARRIARPLLAVPRAELLDHARERGLRWREDSSNASDAYARNRLRRHWLPALAREFNPQLLRKLAEFAETMATEREWLRGLVEAEARQRFTSVPGGFEVTAQGWSELDPALARRLVRWSLIEIGVGRELTRRHVERMLAFLVRAPTGPRSRVLELPDGVRLSARSGAFALTRSPRAQSTTPAPPTDADRACGAAAEGLGTAPDDTAPDPRLKGASLRPC